MPIDDARSPAAQRLNVRTGTALAVCLLLWASTFAGLREAVRSYSPGHLMLLRFLSASAAMALWALWHGVRRPHRRAAAALTLAGLAGISWYQWAIGYGAVTIPAGTITLLNNTAPIFTAIGAAVFLRERMGRLAWIGTIISFCGAAVLALRGGGPHIDWRALVVIGGAVGTATYTLLAKRLLRRYSALDVTAWAIWVGTAALLVFLPGFTAAVRAAPPRATLLCIYLGVFPAAVANLLWARVLAHIPASRAANFTYLLPALSFLIAWIWLGETITAAAIVGGGLMIGGMALVNYRHRPAPLVGDDLS